MISDGTRSEGKREPGERGGGGEMETTTEEWQIKNTETSAIGEARTPMNLHVVPSLLMIKEIAKKK